ncbi:MAG: hypothetical protein U9Q22_04015 [Candidatus Altiarchaeota archaeon]|nr:hypothetical protein [Candidatus Altiarchaeota archaeon]
MDERYLLVIVCILSLSSFVSAAQIIVINESEERVYAIEQVTLSGDLSKNLLNIYGEGEVIKGENVRIYLFGPSSDVLVSDLVVNGEGTSVSFDEKGYFFIADEGEFRFQGSLKIRTIGQLRLFVRGPVNQLSFNLKHGYAIDGDRFGVYNKEVIIQRAEKISMLVDGSFRYSYAERDGFLYIIKFKAFGSSLGNYILNLPNNEVVSSVQGAVKWEQKGNKLILDLESGEASVTVRGFFNSKSLRIPLKEDRHHVLIESDPEKKISVSTSAEEIDLKESSITPQYSNARAFLASSRDIFKITIKKLDVLPSLAASVSRSENRIAITEKGSIVGELNYRYSNTGVDYIEIDVEGTPLYASTGRGAVKLTKEDKLLLSFPKGTNRNLDLVYFTTRDPLKPVDLIEIPLARSNLPITSATTSIYLPKEYLVLETFGVSGGSELPPIESALLYLVLVGLIASILKRGKRFIIYYLLFSVGLFYFNIGLFLLLIALSIILIVKRYIPKKPEVKWLLAGAALLVAVFIALFVAFIFIWQLGVFSAGAGVRHAPTGMGADYAMVEEANVPVFKGLKKIGEGEGAITVPTRKGVLPVKLELPRLGKTITVTNHLVTKGKQINLKVLVIAEWFKYILYLIALFTGILTYKMYKKGGKK